MARAGPSALWRQRSAVACGAQTGPGEALCGRCRRGLTRLGPGQPPVAGIPVWAPVAYAGPARDLVAGLKFRGGRALAVEMAAQIGRRALRRALSQALPWSRFRCTLSRARAGVQPGGRDRGPSGRPDRPCRVGLPDARRPANPPGGARPRGAGPEHRGRIALAPGCMPPGSALLVDDVITTGRTLAACAAALQNAGAHHVAAISYARTTGR